MNDFPDFSEYSYRVEGELGHNRAGGRVTYLATDLETQQKVVIKQFQFAKVGSTWSSFDSYDREIQLLKELDHPGIPCYLNSFQTPDGFCMVQEYKEAESLATSRSFSPDEVKKIAIAALEVLVYLQNRIPPIIHRDIKPENILVDQSGNLYLVDFGFARVGEGEVGVSSVVKGTLGFMPPEQLFNRQLTEASDLYGLGMTLICLLTATKTDRIGDLVDISYRVSFKHLVPKLNFHWVNWLEKMVEPRLKDRFPNAVTALAAVPALPLRPPEAQFSQTTVQLMATHRRELLRQTVTITNPIPDTLLEGEWSVSPHPHDPPIDLYQWINIEPSTFVGNQVNCQITVDTNRLIAGKIYKRNLLLHTNTLAKSYSLSLQIQTVPAPAQSHLFHYKLLLVLGLFSFGVTWLIAWIVAVTGMIAESPMSAGFGAILGSAIGLEASAWMLRTSGWRTGASANTLAAILVGGTALVNILTGLSLPAGSGVVVGAIVGAVGASMIGIAMGTAIEKLLVKESQKSIVIALAILSVMLSVALGLGLTFGFAHSWIASLLVFSGLASGALLLNIQLRLTNNALLQRKAERYLIKP
ncbi:MAG: serine/threonine-protein kinase [Leptolyngbyaceae cyanobacterium bins.349]|nr:serine/threonine-protein kinase [Leptolyngbyaceae cyanobacterium bins.349]